PSLRSAASQNSFVPCGLPMRCPSPPTTSAPVVCPVHLQPRVKPVHERTRPAAGRTPLATYTTLRLGGPAAELVVADSDEAAVEAVRAAADPVLVLAGGSNVVVADAGFAGRVVLLRNRGYAVLSVDFSLAVSPLSAPIRYAELARTLGVDAGGRVPLEDARAAVLKLRAGKGMVLDPADPDSFSAGSFFTNPVLDATAFAALRERAGEPPHWPNPDGSVKVSAAWLIERAGFGKGYGRDGVGISTKHTLALTNRGTGSTAALLALAAEIRDGVRDRFGIALHPEPVLVGCA